MDRSTPCLTRTKNPRIGLPHTLHHGRCSSPWIQHPEPTGSGEQRPTQICNIHRDIPAEKGMRMAMQHIRDVSQVEFHGLEAERPPQGCGCSVSRPHSGPSQRFGDLGADWRQAPHTPFRPGRTSLADRRWDRCCFEPRWTHSCAWRQARPARRERLRPTSFHTNSVDLIEGCSRDNKIPQTL